jgi:hypothetical protein
MDILSFFSTLATPSAEMFLAPQRTWVFVVGVLHFKANDSFESFPTANRRDTQLVQFFKSQGVPGDQIIALYDEAATHEEIGQSLVSLLHRAAPGDALFLYYTGHGYRENSEDAFFTAYDTGEDVPGWSINSICPLIARYFLGDKAFLAADCCNSGYLAEVVQQQQGRVNYACVTSSSARELSTGHWTFSDCLLDALHGEPYIDLNQDGMITLDEFAAYARDEMALAEEQHASFGTTAGFPLTMALATAKPRPATPIGERVKVKYENEWFAGRVVATEGQQWQVRYIGYDDPADWFDSQDKNALRQLKVAPGFAVGTLIDVKWQGEWYPARVMETENGVHLVHYTGYDHSWDEWVPSKRIRVPK